MDDKKVALITGSYRGLGLETARQLGKKGYKVFITARKPKEGKVAVDNLTSQGIEAEFVPLDVRDAKSIQVAVKEVSKKTKHLDALVNNAAVLGESTGSPLKVKEQDLVDVFETNTVAPWIIAQAFLPLLLKTAKPRIVNVSSGAGQLSGPQGWAPAYSLSKTGLNSVTNQLATALKGKVSVNSVCPGWVRTEMGGKDAPRSVEEGADSIAWLASESPWSESGLMFRDRQVVPW